MPNICHTISTSAGKAAAMAAITTLDGLNGWWTSGTRGDPAEGGELQFHFGGPSLEMSVISVDESEVIWSCIGGPEEWLGTKLTFRLQTAEEGGTAIYFTHAGWAEETPFHYHCSMKWAVFMLSLKGHLDRGEGRPFPDDIKIEDVN